MANNHRSTAPSSESRRDDNEPSPKKLKRTRTRTGCLNCRRKKRKCDEGRPSCGGCSKRRETCHWGVKVTFRQENAYTILDDHPSMKMTPKKPRRFEIMDVTDEVVRDYHDPPSLDDYESDGETRISPIQPTTSLECDGMPAATTHGEEYDTARMGLQNSTRTQVSATDRPSACSAALGDERTPGEPVESPASSDAVANLIYFSQGGSAPTPFAVGGGTFPKPPLVTPAVDSLPVDAFLGASPHIDAGFDFGDHLFTPDGSYDDGIFLPGSTYHELHATLRNHLIQEVKSNIPTRPASPEARIEPRQKPISQESSSANIISGTTTGVPRSATREPSADHEPPYLSPEQECALWKNWIDEISPWLDKFDNERHFQHVLPDMARSHDHLRYSMLALSARQLELKDASRATDLSLALYQEAIHLLLPRLSTRETPVIASCSVLCVLEMCSCSPKAWRRHLDGCASLMGAVGMTGFDGGLEQALFWCFARMDVCGGLISSVKTLIPTDRWACKGVAHNAEPSDAANADADADASGNGNGVASSGNTPAGLEADVALFKSAARDSWTMFANYAVYLCAQVLDLLAPLAKANPGGLFFEGPRSDMRYRAEWLRLWKHVEEWHAGRPSEMRHVMAIPSSATATATAMAGAESRMGSSSVAGPSSNAAAKGTPSPFPAILFSNAAAISGNQLYHTASLLMLQNRPSSLRPSPRPRSALWHARQICGISMTNHHHGAWTNSIQPLWIAGRCMSHPAEHRAILDLLAKIERESGWSTKWRADDLQEFWGDLGD